MDLVSSKDTEYHHSCNLGALATTNIVDSNIFQKSSAQPAAWGWLWKLEGSGVEKDNHEYSPVGIIF